VKKILLISNKVMHYRVSVYNYFYKRFKDYSYEFIVRSNRLHTRNMNSILFDFKEIEFKIGKYIREIERIKPNIIILFLHLKEPVYWFLVHWLKYKNIPFVYWNKAINYDDQNNRIKNFLFHYMHNRADAIILYSETEKENIKKKNWKKLFYANNTVNFEDFPTIKETKKEIKNEFKIDFERVVLFTGRMDIGGGRKKIDHLIRIFTELEREDIGLVIVGSGYNEKIDKMIKKKKNIRYLGEIHDPKNIQISKIFKMADVFSIPGHIGLGINQAMFLGLPVVTEEGDQPPEINYLIDGKTGFIVKNNDVNALKEKILYIIDNKEFREKLSKNARKHILKVASIENMFNTFKKSCDKVIKDQKK